jgi:hypothetical protein
MRLSIIAAVAALGSVALAQTVTVNSTVVVQSINTLTIKTQAVIEPAKQLTVLNAGLLLLGQGPWAVRLPSNIQTDPFFSTGSLTPARNKTESHHRPHRHCGHSHGITVSVC